MPNLIRPPGQSREVDEMIGVVGSRARTQILHLLSAKGPLTTAQLTAELDADRSATYRHLLALEQAGYVKGDLSQAERSGRGTVRWSAIQERIDETAHLWHQFASGKNVDQPAAAPDSAH